MILTGFKAQLQGFRKHDALWDAMYNSNASLFQQFKTFHADYFIA